ncbi:MAG: metallophosphoesterase, partial [bacterium]
DSFEWMIDKNVNEIKPELIVILGDVYDTFDPSNTVTGFFSRQLRKCNDAKIPVVILTGNHDICSKNHALQSVMELNLKSIKVIETPTAFKFKDTLLMMFPYSVEVEKKQIEIRVQLLKFIEETKVKISKNSDLQNIPILFGGHFGVRGAALNEKHVNNDKKDIDLDDLDNVGADYCFMGDYHKHLILKTKCKSMYIGSVERTDMSEANDKKGFIVYDTSIDNGKYGCCQFIEYLKVRPMVKLKGNLSEINSLITLLDSSYKGAIVQIEVCGDRSEMIEFENAQVEIRNRLKNMIDPICVRTEQTITNKEIIEQGEKVEHEIMETKYSKDDEVKNAVKSTINDLEKDEDERLVLNNMADDIFKEVRMSEQ